ncbi:MAG: hypothetical protein JKX88_11750 [Marinicaulis sp.]|nr:hypothetical protein [Marinicaulis sp.]
MITINYVAQNIRGVWKMAFGGEGDGHEDLDFTTDGVFKSLWAIIISAPFALLAFAAGRRVVMDMPQYNETIFANAPFSLLLTAELGALALYWSASIAALVMTARAINASRQIASLIVAFNWSQLLGFMIIALPATLFGMTGNMNIYVLAILPASFLSLAILWGVLRRCLPINIIMTISLIAMLVLIEIMINTLVTHGAVAAYQALS